MGNDHYLIYMYVDCCATAFNHLARESVIPDFEVPEMGSINPFNIWSE